MGAASPAASMRTTGELICLMARELLLKLTALLGSWNAHAEHATSARSMARMRP